MKKIIIIGILFAFCGCAKNIKTKVDDWQPVELNIPIIYEDFNK